MTPHRERREKPEQSGHHATSPPLRKHARLLGDLRIEILRPVDQLRALQHLQERAEYQKHRRIRLRHHHIRTGKHQGFQQKRRDHQRITERPCDQALLGEARGDTDHLHPAPNLLARIGSLSRRRQHRDIPSGGDKTMGHIFQDAPSRPAFRRIDPIDEEDGWHGEGKVET